MNENTPLFGLTAIEFALLEFTNDRAIDLTHHLLQNRGESLIVTTRESYIWAVSAALIIVHFQQLSEYDLLEAYRKAVQTTWSEEVSLLDYEMEQSYYFAQLSEQCTQLYDVFLNYFDVSNDRFNKRVRDETLTAYNGLKQKQLIETGHMLDIAGIGVGAMGLSPLTFICKTAKGRLLHRQIMNRLSRLEQTSEESTEKRLVRLLGAFKKVLVEVFEAR